MTPEDTYRVALVRAAEILGGARALSDRLQVSMPDLARWLAGAETPSVGTFLKVVDILIEESRKSSALSGHGDGSVACFPSGPMSDSRQELLREAARLVGNEALAKQLNVPETLLDAWLRGLATMPDRKMLPLAEVLQRASDSKK